MQELSTGQQRIREIVKDKYPEFLSRLNSDIDECWDWSADFVLKGKLFADQEVRGDKITGKNLLKQDVSKSYIHWLQKTAKNECKYEGSTPGSIKLDRSIFDWDADFLVNSGPLACQGGRKRDSTFGSLFKLHENKTKYSSGWSINYYQPDGILEPGSDGNHRTLASILYGASVMNTLYYRVVYSEPDPLLNNSLVKLEQFFTDLTQSTFGTKKYRRFGFCFQNYSEEESDLIRFFWEDITLEEIEDLKKAYLDNHHLHIDGCTNTTINIKNMVNVLSSIREIRGKSKPQVQWLKFYDWWNGSRTQISHLERELLGIRDRRFDDFD